MTVNISSPNTKNLRQLQGADELDALLAALKDKQQRLADMHGKLVPLALKIAPDLDDEQIKSIAGTLLRHRFEGVIATNTTLARTAVAGMQHGDEAGGLSGKPVFDASNEVIRKLRAEVGETVPIIGVGGIFPATTRAPNLPRARRSFSSIRASFIAARRSSANACRRCARYAVSVRALTRR